MEGNGRATSSLRDARGAELKRRGIKGSIRIEPRRGISCVIRREAVVLAVHPRGSQPRKVRGTRVRNKGRGGKVKRVTLFVTPVLASPI